MAVVLTYSPSRAFYGQSEDGLGRHKQELKEKDHNKSYLAIAPSELRHLVQNVSVFQIENFRKS